MKDGRTTDEKTIILKKKILYHIKAKEKVFVKKNNGMFYVGKILESSSDMIILSDRILGSIPIYLFEIFEIEKARGQ